MCFWCLLSFYCLRCLVQGCTYVNVQIPQGCLRSSFIKASSWKAYKCWKTPSASPMCIYQESGWDRLGPPRLTQAVSCGSRDHARINIQSSVLESTSEDHWEASVELHPPIKGRGYCPASPLLVPRVGAETQHSTDCLGSFISSQN